MIPVFFGLTMLSNEGVAQFVVDNVDDFCNQTDNLHYLASESSLKDFIINVSISDKEDEVTDNVCNVFHAIKAKHNDNWLAVRFSENKDVGLFEFQNLSEIFDMMKFCIKGVDDFLKK